MAHDEPTDIPELKGYQKYFNSYTIKGRANVTKAVYGLLFVGFITYKLKSHGSAPKK